MATSTVRSERVKIAWSEWAKGTILVVVQLVAVVWFLATMSGMVSYNKAAIEEVKDAVQQEYHERCGADLRLADKLSQITRDLDRISGRLIGMEKGTPWDGP